MKFSIPSITELFDAFAFACNRFPLTILIAALGCAALTGLTHWHQPNDQLTWTTLKFITTCLLSLPLFIAIRANKLTGPTTPVTNYLLHGLAIAFLTLYYFLTPIDQVESIKFVTRFLGLNLAFHLLVSFAPFVHKRDNLRFWEFNKTLFVNAVIGGLYVVVLGVGLMFSLLALEQLFELDIDDKTYLTVWIWLIGFVLTVYFLRHFPHAEDIAETSIEVPNALHVFLKYILVPLVILYFIILYAYSAKILIDFEWPEGWISKLILGFSSAGILTFLLSYPIHRRALKEEGYIIQFFGKHYFKILLPMCVLLAMAIYRRTSEYGLTEARYFALAMTIWLSVLTIYMVFSKSRHILFVPISLFVFAVFSVLGPLNAYQVSFRSQVDRLLSTLSQNGLLENGKFISGDASVPEEDAKKIYAGIDYLFETDQEEFFKTYVNAPPDSAVWSVEHVMKMIALDRPATGFPQEGIYLRLDETQSLDIAGYEYAHLFYILNESPTNRIFHAILDQGDLIFIASNGMEITRLSATDLERLFSSQTKGGQDVMVTQEAMSHSWQVESKKYKVIFKYLSKNRSAQEVIWGEGIFLSGDL